MMGSDNGKLGTAAALFNLVKLNDTVEICSRYCVYSYNNTRSGHGGMWFNNFWTPIGAWAAGEQGFKHFMKGQAWWRELYRKSDGSFNQTGRGGIGVSYGIPYVAPRKRLRILGSPVSAFGTNCPTILKPALEAHKNRDYAKCEELIRKEMGGIIPAGDMPVVNNMLESVQILQSSIEHDLTFTEKLIKDGKAYYASLELPQLKGVVAASDSRLEAIVAALESPDGMSMVQADLSAIQKAHPAKVVKSGKDSLAAEKGTWRNLIPSNNRQMKVIENVAQVPEGWTEPTFDDSGWNTATLPIPWTMYHTALFRGKFNVEDKSAIDGLRIVGRFFQQQNVLVYLNGELVAKVDEIDTGGGTVTGELNAFGSKQLKNGENTISIATRHRRRWGSYRGTYVTSESVGFAIEGLKK